MSHKPAGTRKLSIKKDAVKPKIRQGRRVIEQNISRVESELNKIDEMETTLSVEKKSVVSKIESKADAIKDLIDKYKDKLCKRVVETHDRNLLELHNLKVVLHQTLDKYKQDKDKCDSSLKKQSTASKSLVSEKKVLQMMLDSVDFTEYKQSNVKLKKTLFDTRRLLDEEMHMKTLIGSIEIKTETLNEISNQIDKLMSIDCPFKEVTALSWNRENDGEMWVCFGADKDLVSMCEDGSRLQYISLDFRIDDVTILNDGTILTTSPDSFCIKRIEMFAGDGKKRAKTIVESDAYLHGITLSIDGDMIVACGTDTPNYSKAKPKVTSIIEYSLQGELLNRITLKGVNGKIYRIAQNADTNYVVTFPKEGRIYSMTKSGDIHGYLSKSQVVKASGNQSDAGFWPSGVCCNSKGNIIVSDWKGKRVMLLDGNCKLLRYIGDVYKNPNALAINSRMDKLLLGDEGVIEIWSV